MKRKGVNSSVRSEFVTMRRVLEGFPKLNVSILFCCNSLDILFVRSGSPE